jgi:D-glycero-D-manno-heptose 1,7-bisphosphate phosphatase
MGIDPMTRRAVFLDRDGVINRAVIVDGKPYPPGPDQLELLPGVPEALFKLRNHGFLLIVVTNQPDVARGTTERTEVDSVNRWIRDRVPLDDIRVCFHDDRDYCACRKPKPGLLLDAARDWSIDLDVSFMVGDRWRDIEAGRRAGCRTVLVDGGHSEPVAVAPDFRAPSLRQASDWILEVSSG